MAAWFPPDFRHWTCLHALLESGTVEFDCESSQLLGVGDNDRLVHLDYVREKLSRNWPAHWSVDVIHDQGLPKRQ